MNMYKPYFNIFLFLMGLSICWQGNVDALTETAVHTAENIKNELAILLKKDTAVMTPAQYAEWKKKVEDGMAYLQKVYPSTVSSYERAVKLREETYQVAHPSTSKTAASKMPSNQESTVSSTLSNKELVKVVEEQQKVVVVQEGVVAFNQALEKIQSFPEEIKKELQLLQLKPGSLPSFYLKWQEFDAVDDLYMELLSTGGLSSDTKKAVDDLKDIILKSIRDGAADLCKAVLHFMLTDVNGLKAQLAFSTALVPLDTLDELKKGAWGDIDHAVSLFLTMNDLLKEGCWQENDILITLLPTMSKDKIEAIKTDLNSSINNTQKNNLPVGMYDQLVANMKKFLQNLDRVVDSSSIDRASYELFDHQCNMLTDYLACMLEYEVVLLKHYNQAGLEISFIDQYNADDLIALLNSIKQKIDGHIAADAIRQKSAIEDFLATFQAASVGIKKEIDAFVNPAVDLIPNIGAWYDQIEKTYQEHLELVEAQKIGAAEHDIVLQAYHKILQNLDTQTVSFINKILAYIENKENMLAINTWLMGLVAAYAKGTKKIEALSADNESQFKVYAKLVQVLSSLFAKGVALEGQSINLKIIVKRAVADQDVISVFEQHINNLFNTAKDTNGKPIGLISCAIASIDNLLLLAQEHMASTDIVLVKAYQEQITPLVQLLEPLFAMENELVAPELQKFVKKKIDAPFSSTSILEDAKILIDPAHAAQFALPVSAMPAATTTTSAQHHTEQADSPVHDLLAVLDSVQHDVTTKLSTINIPTVIPSFADQYAHVTETDTEYRDTKLKFNQQDKDTYKNTYVQTKQIIEIAVIQVALKVATFVCQSGGLFEKQLAYIANLYVNFAKGKTEVLDVGKSADFATILKDAQLLQKICQKGFLPLKGVSFETLHISTIKKDVDQLNELLNKMLDSSPNLKIENTPTGLCDTLISTWLKFFDDWKKSVKKSTVDKIQQMQRQLKPILDLLSCYRTVINTLQEAAAVMPIIHKDIPGNFMDTIESLLNARKAESLIELSVESSSMQTKQAVVSKPLATGATTMPIATTTIPTTTTSTTTAPLVETSVPTSSMQTKQTVASKPLEASATTVPVMTIDASTTATTKTPVVSTASSTASSAVEKTGTKTAANTGAKKDSPAVIALENFTRLKNNFTQAMNTMNISKAAIPDMQQFFDAVEKTKDSFEVDSAWQKVSTDDTTKIENAYQELLFFGVQQAFIIGKAALEYSNSALRTVVKDLGELLKIYDKDQKKVADIKKDQTLKGICDRIKAVGDLCTKSVFQLASIKSITVKGAINTLDAFLQQLSILVDSELKKNTPVGVLNQLLDEWQSLFNEILGYMKTLSVDKVIAYQQDILFLQDSCNVVDRFVTKLVAIMDDKRVIIKRSGISAAFGPLLQEITKKENAAKYAKGAPVETDDVQRALIPLSEAMKQKK